MYQIPQSSKTYTEATCDQNRSISVRAHTGHSVLGGDGAYSSQKGLAHLARTMLPTMSWHASLEFSWPNQLGNAPYQKCI